MRCFLLALPLLIGTGVPSAAAASKQAVAVRAVRPPVIDGILNEEVWMRARPETEFTQQNPFEGEPGSERTEVRILYDDEALYFGCTMFDSSPGDIVARLARRDDEIESDIISIRIDSYHDLQTAFEFTVNAAGVKVDILQYDDGREEDLAWDAVWDAGTEINSSGWVAEIRVPFKSLRYVETAAPVWGIQFIRRISRKQETQHWVLVSKNESGFISRFGTLTGMEHLPSPGHVEILPYVLGSRSSGPRLTGLSEARFGSNAGLDIKFRPSPELTLDATFNPDFGQVEADPAVLNLSTFETFYPERRPFFTEGSQIFRFATFGGDAGGLFYSRRIGRALEPEAPEGGRIVEAPGFSTILGAVKASGRTPRGLSFGALEALTGRESALLEDSARHRRAETLAPLTSYSVLRIRQDILSNSNVGFIATSVVRENQSPAFTGGIDWNLNFLDNTYRVDGFLAASETASSGNGRGHGTAGRFSFSKEGGVHWLGSLSGDFTSRRFNINDLGYFRRPNDYGASASIRYRENDITSLTRFWEVELSYHGRRNFDGAELNNSMELSAEVVLLSYWELYAGVQHDRGRYDDRETRGNGLYRKPSSTRLELHLDSDPRSAVVGDLGLELESDSYGARRWEVGVDVELKPASTVTVELEVAHTRHIGLQSWVKTHEDPAVDLRPFNVFAERTTAEWDVTTRGSLLFTRDVSVQYYLQWFLAKGTYEHPKRMITPSAYEPFPFAAPDFVVREFHSNVVFRWEYMPGSTLFLVWSQSRNREGGQFSAPLRDELGRVFTTVPSNVLLLKVTYWLSI